MEEKTYWVVKDDEGILRPLAGIWQGGKMKKYHQPEIDKFMKRGIKGGMSVVEIKLVEI